jgi:ribonuclease HII
LTHHVLLGIDEAGLGPVLGPLVLAAAGFSGPTGKDPYRLLGKVVSRRGARSKMRVADSKKVYAGRRCFADLERTALTFLSVARGSIPRNVAELLAATRLAPGSLPDCPWYRDLSAPLPREATREEIELLAHRLEKTMDAAGVRCVLMEVRPVEVGEWNRLLAETDNKSTAHLRCAFELVSAAAAVAKTGHLVVDHCGGRMRYALPLQEIFPAQTVRIVQERTSCSVYEVGCGDDCLRITFLEKAEDHAFTVALASCLAKYVRELMVERINAWFLERMPALKETAGYHTDGMRFLGDVGSVIDAPGFPRHLLVRNR